MKTAVAIDDGNIKWQKLVNVLSGLQQQIDVLREIVQEAKPQQTVQEFAQLLLDTMMDEQERNTGKRYHEKGHEIKEICSCGSCHLSYLLARKLHGIGWK